MLVISGWLACILCASGCASPTARPGRLISVVPWADDGLVGRQITTPHYTMFSTLRHGNFEIEVAKRMELLHDSYAETVLPSVDSAERLQVFVLRTRADDASLMSWPDPTDSTGLTTGGSAVVNGQDLLVVANNRAELLADMAHHGWHQYVNSRCSSRLPAWLVEGLACDFEALVFADGRAVRSRLNATRIATLRKLLHGAANMPLSRVVARRALDSTEPGAGHYDERFEAQAWALVSLLRDGAGGKYAGAFDHLLSDIDSGTFGVHTSALTLTSGNDDPISFGETALRVYFDENSTELEDAYFDHMVRLCGF